MSSTNKREWLGPEVLRLIEMYRQAPELWDKEQSRSCSKASKESAVRRIAAAFDTDATSVARKLHNLRTQFNDEMRKIERTSNLEPQDRFVPKWAYFNPLSFLSKRRRDVQESFGEDSTQFEYISLEDDNFSFQEDNKDSLRLNKGIMQPTSQEYVGEHHHSSAPSCEPHENYSAASEPVLHSPTPEQPAPRKRNAPEQEDEFNVFSAFVASELRGLRHESSRKKLKCSIIRAILTAIEAEQVESHGNS